MEEAPFKVLLVDDSAVFRTILKSVITSISENIIVDTAPNGQDAIDKISKASFDAVFLDIEMPIMDGIKTLEVIQQRFSKTPVIMVSGTNQKSADITLKALSAGAMDFIKKPESLSPEESGEKLKSRLIPIFQYLRSRQKRLQHQNSLHQTTFQERASSPPHPKKKVYPHEIHAVAIGVSTGGPSALEQLLPKLPKLGVPIFLVIHMPKHYTESLADRLNQRSKLSIKVGMDRETVSPDTVYIAPGGLHMVANKSTGGVYRIGLNDGPTENSCRPAVDVLFRSIASAYGKHVLSVIMTGMGDDGAKGVQTLKLAGCYSLSQTEKSCTVYGMPRALDEMGLSDERVPLENLASRITSIVLNRS